MSIPDNKEIISTTMCTWFTEVTTSIFGLLIFQSLVAISAARLVSAETGFIIILSSLSGPFLFGILSAKSVAEASVEHMNKKLLYYELITKNVIVDWKNRDYKSLFYGIIPWLKVCRLDSIITYIIIHF